MAVFADSAGGGEDGVRRCICAVAGDSKWEFAPEMARNREFVYMRMVNAEPTEAARKVVDSLHIHGYPDASRGYAKIQQN